MEGLVPGAPGEEPQSVRTKLPQDVGVAIQYGVFERGCSSADKQLLYVQNVQDLISGRKAA